MGFVEDFRNRNAKKEEEQALRKSLEEEAQRECAYATGQYNDCRSGSTIPFSFLWKCRQQAKDKKRCIEHYLNDEWERRKKELHRQGSGSSRN